MRNDRDAFIDKPAPGAMPGIRERQHYAAVQAGTYHKTFSLLRWEFPLRRVFSRLGSSRAVRYVDRREGRRPGRLERLLHPGMATRIEPQSRSHTLDVNRSAGGDAMGCTRHFLNLQWEHHSWRRRVSSTENAPAQGTNMWGRAVNSESGRCHKQDVCEACGKTRRDVDCLCDTAQAERCTIRRAWIDDSRHATE